MQNMKVLTSVVALLILASVLVMVAGLMQEDEELDFDAKPLEFNHPWSGECPVWSLCSHICLPVICKPGLCKCA